MCVQSVKIILSCFTIFILNNISSEPLHCDSEVTPLSPQFKQKLSTHALRSYAYYSFLKFAIYSFSV